MDFDYRRAIVRIERLTAVLVAAGILVVAFASSPRNALGFAAGSALAFVSFILIKRTAFSLSPEEKAEDRPSRSATAAGLVIRQFVIGVSVFAMIKHGGISAWPVFAGLMTTVAAVIAEIVYELATAESH